MASKKYPDYSHLNIEIFGKLGSGTYGTVYNVKHRNNFYALKEYGKGCYYPPTEVDISMRIRTPYLLTAEKVFDPALTNTETTLLLLPLADTSLSSLIRSKDFNLSLHDKKVLFYKIACGLHALHSNGILHLDIKPDNILINEEQENGVTVYKPRIADFGLSKYVVSVQSGMSVKINKRNLPTIGTPNYMPPEHFNLEGVYGGFTDIWSLGAIATRLFFNVRVADSNDIKVISKYLRDLKNVDKYDALIKRIQNSYTKTLQPIIKKRSKSANSTPSVAGPIDDPDIIENNNILEFIKLMLKADYRERIDINMVLSHEFFNDINVEQPYSYTIAGNFINMIPSTDINDAIMAIVHYHDHKSNSSRPTNAIDFFQAIDVVYTTYPMIQTRYLKNIKSRRAFGMACVMLCHQSNCIRINNVISVFEELDDSLKKLYNGVKIEYVYTWINAILNKRSGIVRGRNIFGSASTIDELKEYRLDIINDYRNYSTFKFCTKDPIENRSDIDSGILYRDIM